MGLNWRFEQRGLEQFFRQVVFGNQGFAIIHQGNSDADDVVQLADIARPAIVLKRLYGRCREANVVFPAIFESFLFRQRVRQRLNVGALAQGGQCDAQAVQPVIKVFPEAAAGDFFAQPASFEETQETLALLKILALGNQAVEAGRVKPVAKVVARLKAKRVA